MIDVKKDFEKFAISRGIGSNTIDGYNKYNIKNAYINPTVIEERDTNCVSIDVFSRLLMERQIFLGTEINSDVANIISSQLLWLEQQNDEKDIQMLISSPGGSVYAGYEILDTMEYINPKVSTLCLGMTASMAAVLAACGEKGKRYILPHSRYLIHQPLGGAHGQASQIEIEAEEILKIKHELYDILTEHSNLTYEEIAQKADRDCYLTAQEAVNYGFIDEIIKRKNGR